MLTGVGSEVAGYVPLIYWGSVWGIFPEKRTFIYLIEFKIALTDI